MPQPSLDLEDVRRATSTAISLQMVCPATRQPLENVTVRSSACVKLRRSGYIINSTKKVTFSSSAGVRSRMLQFLYRFDSENDCSEHAGLSCPSLNMQLDHHDHVMNTISITPLQTIAFLIKSLLELKHSEPDAVRAPSVHILN